VYFTVDSRIRLPSRSHVYGLAIEEDATISVHQCMVTLLSQETGSSTEMYILVWVDLVIERSCSSIIVDHVCKGNHKDLRANLKEHGKFQQVYVDVDYKSALFDVGPVLFASKVQACHP
jgi:hypothetical protein